MDSGFPHLLFPSKNVSMASFDKVTSIVVPKTVTVLANKSSASFVLSRNGITKRVSSDSFDGKLFRADFGGEYLFNSFIVSIKKATAETVIKRFRYANILARHSRN